MIRRGFFATLLLPFTGCHCKAVVVDVPPQQYKGNDKKYADLGWRIRKCIGIHRCWLHRGLNG